MADIINIAQFDIDIDGLIDSTQEVKSSIDEIVAAQKELTKQGQTSSKEFVKNAAQLKGLRAEYSAQLRVLEQVGAATGQFLDLENDLTDAMGREASSINDLRKQISDLTKIRNNLSTTTEEGRMAIEAINQKIEENNNLIKENVSQNEQAKMNVGNYAESIKAAFADLDIFGASQRQVNETVAAGSTYMNAFSTSVKTSYASMTQGATAAAKFTGAMRLLGTAIIGTGIGAILVLIASFVSYIRSSEEASNRFSKALSGVTSVVRQLFKYLEPLGEFIMDVLEKGLERVGRVATAAMEKVATALRFLGFENAATHVDKFNESMQKSVILAQQYEDAQNRATESQRQYNITQLEYQRQAEKLRQIRDDENISTAERIHANEELGDLLQRQILAEKQLAAQALAAANLKIAAYGATKEALDEQAAAMERMVDIEERIEGQRSEQLTNRVSLEKDGASKAKEAAQERIETMNQELDLYIAQQGLRALTLEQQLKQEEDFSKRRKKILEEELKSGLITQAEYSRSLLEIASNLSSKRSEIAVDAVRRELEAVENRFEVERAMSEAVGQIAIDAERKRAEQIREIRAQYESERFEQGITNEIEYQEAIAEVNQQYQLKSIELDKKTKELLKEQREEQRQLDFDSAMVALEAQGATEFEIRQLQIDQQREAALEQARLQYTDKAMLAQAELNINQQAKNAELQMEREKDEAILSSRADLFGAISQLVGEETALGKAAAIAQATINTYQGATKALATLPPPASYIAAATTIASGLSSVAKISGISGAISGKAPDSSISSTGQVSAFTIGLAAPFATGGKVTGGIPIRRSNGDNILATLKKGEVVLNERQQRALGGDAIFRSIGVPGFATGGIAGSTTATLQRTVLGGLDRGLADAIGVAVRDGARVGTETGSRQGIGDAATDNYLRNLSSF